MHACDWRGLERRKPFSQVPRVRQIWQQLCERIERNGKDSVIELLFGILNAKPHALRLDGQRLHAIAEPDNSAARSDIFLRSIIQVCQWNAWNSHAVRVRRFHG